MFDEIFPPLPCGLGSPGFNDPPVDPTPFDPQPLAPPIDFWG